MGDVIYIIDFKRRKWIRQNVKHPESQEEIDARVDRINCSSKRVAALLEELKEDARKK